MENQTREKHRELTKQELDKKMNVISRYDTSSKRKDRSMKYAKMHTDAKMHTHVRKIGHMSDKSDMETPPSKRETNISLPEIPLFRFKPNESLDQLGNRMWSEYHKATIELPEDASPKMVQNVLRGIKKSMLNHPCSTCKNHARKNLRKVPLEGTTKHDAVEKVFEFHNEVNRMLNKDEFSTHDFQRVYKYDLNK